MKSSSLRLVHKAKSDFAKGDFRSVLSLLHRPRLADQVGHLLLSSLCQLGRWEEALQIWKQNRDKFDTADRSAARFYLGVAMIRASRLKSARQCVRANQTTLRQTQDPKALFYAYQGRAFLNYYLGQFDSANRDARRSHGQALASGDPYQQMLATDLLAHCRARLGDHSGALNLLRQAHELAKTCGHVSAQSAIEVSLLLYEAESGRRAETIIEEIEKCVASFNAQDNYSRSDLTLEWARQLTLHGQWQSARALLDQVAPAIYESGNRWQELKLQLRLAEVAYRQGDFSASRHFIQGARRCWRKVEDVTYESAILGMEYKLALVEQQKASAQVIRRQLAQLAPRNLRTRQTLSLMDGMKTLNLRSGEDLVYDLLRMSTTQPRKACDLALKKGWFSLWAQIRGYRNGGAVLCLAEDRHTYAISPLGIQRSSRPLTERLSRLLIELLQGNVKRPELFQGSWGIRYDGERHDHLLNVTIADLRKALGTQAGRWIQTTEEGWFLENIECWNDVGRAVKLNLTEDRRALGVDPKVEVRVAAHSSLNFRQRRFVQHGIKSSYKDEFDLQDYKGHFGVSTMTAFRDIKGLVSAGFVKVTGRGRATKYLRKTD
jgi:hypothetical protein